MKYKCPCCGYYTFTDRPTGNYDICGVCYWEDDSIQSADPNYTGGANSVSLSQARANYRMFRACSRDMIPYVRQPRTDELEDID